jgi:hypothetical protein
MEETSNFMERIRLYVDKRVRNIVAQNQDIDAVQNTTINGYRSLGTFQLMQYGDTSVQQGYTIGSSSTPIVSN